MEKNSWRWLLKLFKCHSKQRQFMQQMMESKNLFPKNCEVWMYERRAQRYKVNMDEIKAMVNDRNKWRSFPKKPYYVPKGIDDDDN